MSRANPKPISKATMIPRMATATPRTIATQPAVRLVALPQQSFIYAPQRFRSVSRRGASPKPSCQRGIGRSKAPQLTAFFTSPLILASSVAVNSFSAKATGHRAPSSRFAASLKPSVAYRVLNFCAGWKKQTTLPSLE